MTVKELDEYSNLGIIETIDDPEDKQLTIIVADCDVTRSRGAIVMPKRIGYGFIIVTSEENRDDHIAWGKSLIAKYRAGDKTDFDKIITYAKKDDTRRRRLFSALSGAGLRFVGCFKLQRGGI